LKPTSAPFNLDWFARGERRLAADAASPSPSRRLLVFACWLACVAGLIVAVKLAVFPVIWEKLGDVVVILDTGWRIWNGQVPHRDFYSVIGPFPLGVFASGFFWRHQDITGLPLALTVAGIVFSVLSWPASKDRLSIWWRLVVALQILLLPAAMAFLGGGEDLRGGKGPPFDFAYHTNYGMQYNRLGWAALLVQMLIILIPRRSGETARQAAQDGILAGVVMGLGIFCKINYLLAAVGLGFWWVLVSDRRGRRSLALLVGLAIATGALAVFPGGVFDYFLDQWRMLHVSRTESHVASLLIRVRANLAWLIVLPILHLSLIAARDLWPGARGDRSDIARWSANFVVAILVSLFVTTFNAQRGEIPGLLIAGLISLEMVMRGAGGLTAATDGSIVTKSLLLKICCALLAWSELCYDAGSVLYAAAWKLRKPRWAEQSESLTGLLAPLPIPVHFDEPTEKAVVDRAIIQRPSGPWINTGLDNYLTTRQVARWTNDGVDLLKGIVRPSDRLFVAAWMNPFNLALNLPPAKGGAMLWDYDRFMDDRTHPDVQQALADVTLFLVPKRADWNEQRDFMLKWYGRGLDTDFQVLGESKFWTCWGRVNRGH
jgi:hypothetical protein